MAEFDETGVEVETTVTNTSGFGRRRVTVRTYPPTVIPAEPGYFVYEFEARSEAIEGDTDLHMHTPVLAWMIRPVLTHHGDGSTDFETPRVVPVVLDGLLVGDRFYVYRCPDGAYRYDGYEIGRTQEEAARHIQAEKKRQAVFEAAEARRAEQKAADGAAAPEQPGEVRT